MATGDNGCHGQLVLKLVEEEWEQEKEIAMIQLPLVVVNNALGMKKKRKIAKQTLVQVSENGYIYL